MFQEYGSQFVTFLAKPAAIVHENTNPMLSAHFPLARVGPLRESDRKRPQEGSKLMPPSSIVVTSIQRSTKYIV